MTKQKMWGWIVLVACVFVTLAGSWAVYACRPPASEVPAVGGDADVEEDSGLLDDESAIVPAAIEVDLPKEDASAVEEAADPVVEEVVGPAVEEAKVETSVSKQEICLAAAYALNPEWDLRQCDQMKAASETDDRQTRCRGQRAPLGEFAQTFCRTIVEETDREEIDLLVPPAVIERESSGGRVQFDRRAGSYYVSTAICEMFLSTGRIVSREPSERWEGAEVMVWTYGDDRRQNRQAVRVVEETADGVRVNTCIGGEEGIMQTVPREWRQGTVVEATGEVLRGSTNERRQQVAADPVLQVRLGVQALAEHRLLCPEDQRGFFGDWIVAYNLGSCSADSEHGKAYACKVMRHYRQACSGYLTIDGETVPRVLNDVWPGCREVAEAYAARCGEVD